MTSDTRHGRKRRQTPICAILDHTTPAGRGIACGRAGGVSRGEGGGLKKLRTIPKPHDHHRFFARETDEMKNSSSRQPPKPDPAWTPRAKAVWRGVLADFDFDGSHDLSLLRELCATITRIDRLRATIDKDGECYVDRFGQPRVHPAVDAERRMISELRLLYRELRLGEPPVDFRPMRLRTG